uniref:Uncharacterized protein n=1 Tax=Anopheles melas TaxID=34690 RepID=A0A182TIA1_9DIPT
MAAGERIGQLQVDPILAHRRGGQIPVPAAISQRQRVLAEARLILCPTIIQIAQIEVKVATVVCSQPNACLNHASPHVLPHDVTRAERSAQLVQTGPCIPVVVPAHAALAVVRAPLHLEATAEQLVVGVVGQGGRVAAPP